MLEIELGPLTCSATDHSPDDFIISVCEREEVS